MGKSVSKSIQQSSTKSAYSVGNAMVISNSGLSLFDHPVNRENRNVVVNLLQDLNMPIIAVWLVARPINRQMSGAFEHWVVKIQSRGCLISIDFLESDGKGAFGLQQRTDVGAELSEFMYYAVIDPETGNKTKHKWQIISSVTPHPFRNSTYLNFLSDFDRLQLEEYIKNSKIAPSDPSKFMKDIKCKRTVCDIAEFAALWTGDDRGYNAITKNCQQFAAQLFAYLVGPNYREEIERVFDRYQSPFDKRKWEQNRNGFREKIVKFQEKEQKASSSSNKRKTNGYKKHQRHKPQTNPTQNSRKRRSLQTDEFFDGNIDNDNNQLLTQKS